MTAAQVRLVSNVIRMGQSLDIHWDVTEGMSYTVRYGFRGITGTIRERITYGSVGYAVTSEVFGEQNPSQITDGMIYLDSYSGNGSLVGTTQVDFTVAGASILIPYISASFCNLGESVTVSTSSTSSSIRPESNYLGCSCGNDETAFSLKGNSSVLATSWSGDLLIPLRFGKEYPDRTWFYVEFALRTEIFSILSGTTTFIGQVVRRLEVRVPNNEKTRPKVTLSTQAETTLGQAFQGLIIRGKTKIRARLETESQTSEIRQTWIESGFQRVDGTEAVFDLTGSALTISGKAVDERGYEGYGETTVTAMNYAAPSVVPPAGYNKIVCARCLSDGTPSQNGEFLLIRAGRRYTSIESGGQQLNKCLLRYRIKAASAEDYSGWVTLLSETASGNEYSGVVSSVVLNAKTGYSVQVGVLDTIGEAHNVTVPIPASGVPFHVGRGNRNVSVGGYCDYSRTDVFDIHFTPYFFTGAAAQPVFENGSWAVGEYLDAVVPEADTAGIGTYNLVIAVSDACPLLLARTGNMFGGYGYNFVIETSDGSERLMLRSAEYPITALYKLL